MDLDGKVRGILNEDKLLCSKKVETKIIPSHLVASFPGTQFIACCFHKCTEVSPHKAGCVVGHLCQCWVTLRQQVRRVGLKDAGTVLSRWYIQENL